MQQLGSKAPGKVEVKAEIDEVKASSPNSPDNVPLPTLEELVQWAKTSNVKLLFDIKDADEAVTSSSILVIPIQCHLS